jgi:hypothetical protein
VSSGKQARTKGDSGHKVFSRKKYSRNAGARAFNSLYVPGAILEGESHSLLRFRLRRCSGFTPSAYEDSTDG